MRSLCALLLLCAAGTLRAETDGHTLLKFQREAEALNAQQPDAHRYRAGYSVPTQKSSDSLVLHSRDRLQTTIPARRLSTRASASCLNDNLCRSDRGWPSLAALPEAETQLPELHR